jgi:hypothetical protein
MLLLLGCRSFDRNMCMVLLLLPGELGDSKEEAAAAEEEEEEEDKEVVDITEAGAAVI